LLRYLNQKLSYFAEFRNFLFLKDLSEMSTDPSKFIIYFHDAFSFDVIPKAITESLIRLSNPIIMTGGVDL